MLWISRPAPRSPAVPSSFRRACPAPDNGSSGGTLAFNSLRENQRAALLLANGVIYFGFSSHGDNEPFHGWVLGYNASTLQRVMVFCTTPNGENGGVWMDGDGVATDSTGSLYFISGDGDLDANTGGNDYGDSFLRLSTERHGPGLLLPERAIHPRPEQPRSRVRGRAPAPGPERSASTRDGQRRQERHHLSRRPRQYGRTSTPAATRSSRSS